MAKKSPRMALPGEMYQKNGRWWWKVRLPGEPRVRARALKPNGARFAPKTRKVAEEVACERWRLSIEDETEARVKSEIQAKADQVVAKARTKDADAIAKVKAECHEQLEASAQALARAHEKTRAEAVKRTSAEAKLIAQSEQAEILGVDKSAEIEERLDQARAEFEQRENVYRDALNEARQKAHVETEERTRAQAEAQAEASLRAEIEQRSQSQSEALAQAEARAQAESTLRVEAEQRAQMEAQARVIAEAKAATEAELRSEAERRAASQARARVTADTKHGGLAESASKTAPCEGCGQQNIPEHELAKIDSGQLVCPDCLMLIRA